MLEKLLDTAKGQVDARQLCRDQEKEEGEKMKRKRKREEKKGEKKRKKAAEKKAVDKAVKAAAARAGDGASSGTSDSDLGDQPEDGSQGDVFRYESSESDDDHRGRRASGKQNKRSRRETHAAAAAADDDDYHLSHPRRARQTGHVAGGDVHGGGNKEGPARAKRRPRKNTPPPVRDAGDDLVTEEIRASLPRNATRGIAPGVDSGSRITGYAGGGWHKVASSSTSNPLSSGLTRRMDAFFTEPGTSNARIAGRSSEPIPHPFSAAMALTTSEVETAGPRVGTQGSFELSSYPDARGDEDGGAISIDDDSPPPASSDAMGIGSASDGDGSSSMCLSPGPSSPSGGTAL